MYCSFPLTKIVITGSAIAPVQKREQSELEDLLQQAADITRECGYTPPPSTARQLTERDGIKRASGNSVARPPAKRRVDNREEDALAAYAVHSGGRC
ncbi:hypothetical protein MRX96_053676 [Rhipicephalus microplus]